MAFLYIKPSEFREYIDTTYGPGVDPETFWTPGSEDPTPEGAKVMQWMSDIGRVEEFRPISKWIGGDDSTAILCFGYDYDLLRATWPESLQKELDEYYGPVRCATFRPPGPVSDDFNCKLLRSLGVYFAHSPKRCWGLRELGRTQPFVSLFSLAGRSLDDAPRQFRQRYEELLGDSDFRALLGRYDALSHMLRAAYHYGSHSGTGKHMLTTNYW